MNVPLEIERSLRVDAPLDTARALLADLETTIGRFPKLRKLTRLGPDQYRWEMAVIGSRLAKIAHEVSYGAHYRIDAARGELSWTPLKGVGNASIEGRFRLEADGRQTRLSFSVKGELREVPVPLMYRLLAPPFIQGKFAHLVDEFLARTAAALAAGEVKAPSVRARTA
ncbi:MAG TPA: hypothetical protein VFV27_04245 [Nevskiaceae bacterium]|nr:hypothetical protein [Nevskiaceae bacterium]